MADIEAARAAAERYLDERVRPGIDEPVVIATGKTIVTAFEIVFFYNTAAYLESGSVVHALAGNGPIIVERVDGRVRVADSSRPWEEQVRGSLPID